MGLVKVLEVKKVEVDLENEVIVLAKIRFKGKELEVAVELTYGADVWLFSVSQGEISLSIPEELLIAGAVLVEASKKDEFLRRFIKDLQCYYYNEPCIEEEA
jgi:hypothetical protein